MYGLQPTHLAIIVIVALLIFGPARLPEIGRAFGKTLREFQDATKEAARSMQEQAQLTETKSAALPQASCAACRNPIQAGMKFCPACGAAQQTVTIVRGATIEV